MTGPDVLEVAAAGSCRVLGHRLLLSLVLDPGTTRRPSAEPPGAAAG